MANSFQTIAYRTLEVCNGVTMATVLTAVRRTGLAAGARAFDIGTGNAGVAIRLARDFGFRVTAIELDPTMAELAQTRIAEAGAPVDLRVAASAAVLADAAPAELIVALGATNVTGTGKPTPVEGMSFLATRLRPGGWLLWGDVVWLAEPSDPLRQLVEVTNVYADDDGWRTAAQAAGFEVVAVEISSQPVFDAYADAAVGAVRDWLVEHGDAPEATSVQFNLDRMQAIFDYGRGVFGFGLYLLRKPD